MAQRRMISKTITSSAKFIKMPAETQSLYFHLCISADDDGVCEAFSVMRGIGSSEDNIRILHAKGFIKILNEDLVSYIMDWNEHNLIRADRKIDSIYKDLLLQILPGIDLVQPKERADRKKNVGNGTSHGQPMDGLGEDRLVEGSIEEKSIEEKSMVSFSDEKEDIDISLGEKANALLKNNDVFESEASCEVENNGVVRTANAEELPPPITKSQQKTKNKRERVPDSIREDIENKYKEIMKTAGIITEDKRETMYFLHERLYQGVKYETILAYARFIGFAINVGVVDAKYQKRLNRRIRDVDFDEDYLSNSYITSILKDAIDICMKTVILDINRKWKFHELAETLGLAKDGVLTREMQAFYKPLKDAFTSKYSAQYAR